jgi:hypothetical protein
MMQRVSILGFNLKRYMSLEAELLKASKEMGMSVRMVLSEAVFIVQSYMSITGG